MKKLSAFMLLIVLLFCSGCHAKNQLAVISNDYSNLKKLSPAAFDPSMATNWYIDNPYATNNCYVSEESGKLKIENITPNTETFVFKGNNGYFVGVNLGHMDSGWVRFCPYFANLPEAEPFADVCLEHCHGFQKITADSAYLFTVTENDQGQEITVIRLLSNQNEITANGTYWDWSTVAIVDGILETFLYETDINTFCLITTAGIFQYSPTKGEITKIKQSEILCHLGCNSSVKIGQKLYCGSPMGIYEYNFETQVENWYPMQYKQYLS